ncbi:MAG: hypothetical protein AVDCRST_MAG19-4973 [uncultured Thermomicrobiales bacterium]|uniref:DUF4440 domain-containing protein n=1 Tax=uncultured Thermomicrobiales bacterium TaxID=1645740 RepID=A0A6J4VSP5_9BACT|nr:MAG: hypothetical protein AVDCRST_MAG19-4973 [uncultured Thermomicrobiales bacterium]
MRWRQHHRSVPFAAVAIAAAMVPGALVAQDDTSPTEERVPQPEECRIEPRSADEVATLLGLGEEPTETDAAAPIEIPIPLGRPANKEETDAFDATARELLACLNAEDVLRQAALFTDRAILPVFGPAPTDPAVAEQARADLDADPTPRPTEQLRKFVALTDTSVLEDGRGAAFLVFTDPGTRPGGQETFLLFFAQEGDRWLIDGLLDFTVVRERPDGTPQATPSA